MVKMTWFLRTKPIRVAFNMLFCAVVLAPWKTLPRETVSGFLGRKVFYGHHRWAWLARVVDGMHPNEAFHCFRTYADETRMRRALYANEHDITPDEWLYT